MAVRLPKTPLPELAAKCYLKSAATLCLTPPVSQDRGSPNRTGSLAEQAFCFGQADGLIQVCHIADDAFD